MRSPQCKIWNQEHVLEDFSTHFGLQICLLTFFPKNCRIDSFRVLRQSFCVKFEFSAEFSIQLIQSFGYMMCSFILGKSCTNVNNATNHSVKLEIWICISPLTVKRSHGKMIKAFLLTKVWTEILFGKFGPSKFKPFLGYPKYHYFSSFLASQDALEVMRVTHSVSERSHGLYWCDPGEWWYL